MLGRKPMHPQQTQLLGGLGAVPLQAGTVTGVSAAQTNGIDISSLMAIMIPMMIVVMMMKMMTGAMGSVAS